MFNSSNLIELRNVSTLYCRFAFFAQRNFEALLSTLGYFEGCLHASLWRAPNACTESLEPNLLGEWIASVAPTIRTNLYSSGNTGELEKHFRTNVVSILRKPYNSPHSAPLTCLENLTSFHGHPPFCSPLTLPPSFGASDQLSPLLGAGGQHALQAPNDPPPHAK